MRHWDTAGPPLPAPLPWLEERARTVWLCLVGDSHAAARVRATAAPRPACTSRGRPRPASRRRRPDLLPTWRPVHSTFFASVSGSLTVTTPLLRFRRACPVSPHLRVRPHWSPASCNTVQIVKVLRRPKRWGSLLRKARCSNCKDHVAVPSCAGRGFRRALATLCPRSFTP